MTPEALKLSTFAVDKTEDELLASADFAAAKAAGMQYSYPLGAGLISLMTVVTGRGIALESNACTGPRQGGRAPCRFAGSSHVDCCPRRRRCVAHRPRWNTCSRCLEYSEKIGVRCSDGR